MTASDSAPLEPRRERLLILFLVAVQFAHIVDFMILMPLGPRLMETFGITPGQFGSLVSAYTFSAGICGLAAAPVLDRFSRKRALLTAFAGFIAGTLLCGFSESYPALLAARAVAGGFGGVLSALAMAMIADAVPLFRRGAAMGKLMTAFALASVLGVPLGLFCANRLGWPAPFRILGLSALAVLAAAAWKFPALPRPARAPGGAAENLRRIFLVPRHWLAFAFTTLIMFAGFVVVPFISPTLVQNAGMRNEDLPYIYLLGGVCTFFSVPLIGKLADRRGLYRVFAVMSLLAIAPMLILTHLGRTPLPVALLLTTLFMIVASGRITPGLTLVTAAVDARHRGGFLSVNAACQQIASGLAAMVSGLILIPGPEGRILRYGTVGWLGVAALLLSVAVGSRLKPVE